jgi:hypothetical protein
MAPDPRSWQILPASRPHVVRQEIGPARSDWQALAVMPRAGCGAGVAPNPGQADRSDELPLNAMANASIKMPEPPAPHTEASRFLPDPPVAGRIRRGGADRSGQGRTGCRSAVAR